MTIYKSFDTTKTIDGVNLIDAIDRDWNKIVPSIRGNAAGHKLISVVLMPVAHNVTRGGKKFASLLVRAHGQTLAHNKLDTRIYSTRIDFIVDDAGITEPHNFIIKKGGTRTF
jgi:hypothetical protein